MNILVFLLIALPLSAWMIAPTFSGAPAWMKPGDRGADDLRRRREALLGDLRDLEMDREMGKMDEEDYLRIRAALEGEAMCLMEGEPAPSANPDAPGTRESHGG